MKNQDPLKPYTFHGMDLQQSGKEALGECPFCGNNRFSVSSETSMWRCLKGCKKKGNQHHFVKFLWEKCNPTRPVSLSKLAKEKGLKTQTLYEWGMVRSVIDGSYLLPGFNFKAEVTQLYKWGKIRGRYLWMATPMITHGLHGVPLVKGYRDAIYVCEGPWDGMKLYEVLQAERGRPPRVVAVPGCETFRDAWRPLFKRREVKLLYDNDHPVKEKGSDHVHPPAGYMGMRRASGVLGKIPKNIQYLHWGPKGFSRKLPDGYDIRDALNGKGTVQDVLGKLKQVPEDWLQPMEIKKVQDWPIPCESWKDLAQQWKNALYWTRGLDRSLSVILASVASTHLPGDKLWIRVIGPASSAKSTLAEGISISKKFVKAVSHFTGFYSGSTEKDGKDKSLINKLNDKTLVIKDGDTLLQQPQLAEILSQARDIYDGTSRVHFKNRSGTREYTDIRMTFILCGTGSLRFLDTSELGERFLTCVIMERISDELEDAVLKKTVEAEDRLVGGENEDASALRIAQRMTGGYVEYLRKEGPRLLEGVSITRSDKHRITRIGKFVSYMRARPSEKQIETVEREFAPRLVRQHLRLAKCLAVVMNRKRVDGEVMKRVVKVSFDTASGVVFDICKYLHTKRYGDIKTFAGLVGQREDMVRKYVYFQKKLGVLEDFTMKGQRGRKWRMTSKMKKLYSEVVT